MQSILFTELVYAEYTVLQSILVCAEYTVH